MVDNIESELILFHLRQSSLCFIFFIHLSTLFRLLSAFVGKRQINCKFTTPQFRFIHITKEKFYDRCKTNQSNVYSPIAILTDASSGIGDATARKFIASGYGVIGNARNAEN